MDLPIFLHVVVDILLSGVAVPGSVRSEHELPGAQHFVCSSCGFASLKPCFV